MSKIALDSGEALATVGAWRFAISPSAARTIRRYC